MAQDDDDVECNDGEIEPIPDIKDLEDPMQVVIALTAMSHTMVYNDDAIITATSQTETAEELQGLLNNTYSLQLAPGEGKWFQSLCSSTSTEKS